MRYLGAAWRQTLTPHEKRTGFVLFAVYLFVMPLVMSALVRLLDERMSLWLAPAESNALYYAILLALQIAIFWEFLSRSFRELLRDPHHGLVALSLTLLVGTLITCLVGLIPFPVKNPVVADYADQFRLSPLFLVGMVLLKSAVEEIFYRGLLFSTLRARSAPLAYFLSAGLFALAAVWQYAPTGGVAYLSLALVYLPLGLCLAWCMDVTESILLPLAAREGMSLLFLTLAVRFGGA